jgi:nucleotidyltransferase/DNA polymerase involved in DNA repair
MRSSKFDPRRQLRSVTLNKKIVAGLLLVAAVIFLASVIGGIFRYAWYLGIANGQDDRPVVADRPRKSSGSETTFERDLIASAEIEAGVEAMADDVWALV